MLPLPTAPLIDWTTITKTFEFTSLGRHVEDEATWFKPIVYDQKHPAPSADHQQLSDQLVQWRALVKLPPASWEEDTAERIAALEAAIDQVKRRIWVAQVERNQHGGRQPKKAPLFD